MDENDGARPRVPDEWFVGFHDGLVAQFWRAAGATMADGDDRLVRSLLDLPPGASVLDVPCGDGRLTRRLAAAGYAATGVDIAASEVERARRAAAERASPPGSRSATCGRCRPSGPSTPWSAGATASATCCRPTRRAPSPACTPSCARRAGSCSSPTPSRRRCSRGRSSRSRARVRRDPDDPGAAYRPSESRLESEYTLADAHGHVRARPRGPPRAHDRRGRAHAARRRLP